LRAELAPIISNALEKLKLLLLNMAREATLAALDDLTQRITMLQQRPTSLDEYMAYQVGASTCSRCEAALCTLVLCMRSNAACSCLCFSTTSSHTAV
jgi:hypothetical protein